MKRLQMLVEVARTFAEATIDYDRLLRTVVEQTGRLAGAYCLLWLVSTDRQWLDAAAEYSLDPTASSLRKELGYDRLPLEESVLGESVVRTGQPLLVHTPLPERMTAQLQPEVAAILERVKLRSVVCVPLRVRGVILGALLLVRYGPGTTQFAPADVDYLQVLADHAALTISNARLLAALQQELAEHTRTRDMLDRTEEKLRQAQKMEAIGRLAGGVAHDFNNILSVIIGYTEILLHDLHAAEPMRRDVEEIKLTSARGIELTRQLLAFSRQQVLSPRLLNLNDIVAGIQRMLRRLLGEDIELHTTLVPDLGRCKVDPGQMEQIFLNLVVNARDAMPKGGQVKIQTANVILDEAYLQENTEATLGPNVMLSVSDTGVGMDRATQTRIFEPFFTTKSKRTGTGLGLSTVYGIVKQSGGSIAVQSELGKGTTFKVYFPRVLHQEISKDVSPDASGLQLKASETILVVEDELPLRALLERLLKQEGYTVIEANDGHEALTISEQHPGAIHLLLTDVVMPKMSGRHLAERMLKMRPSMKVLFTSGHIENAIVHHGMLESNLHFLPKPFTPETLLGKVRALLGQ